MKEFFSFYFLEELVPRTKGLIRRGHFSIFQAGWFPGRLCFPYDLLVFVVFVVGVVAVCCCFLCCLLFLLQIHIK